jgi:hypothetical protein
LVGFVDIGGTSGCVRAGFDHALSKGDANRGAVSRWVRR